MPKRSSKPKKDENEAAFDAIARLTDETTPEGKNPAAVYLGRLGGKKGGPARAKALTPAARKKIAQKAARVRWKDHPKG